MYSEEISYLLFLLVESDDVPDVLSLLPDEIFDVPCDTVDVGSDETAGLNSRLGGSFGGFSPTGNCTVDFWPLSRITFSEVLLVFGVVLVGLLLVCLLFFDIT